MYGIVEHAEPPSDEYVTEICKQIIRIFQTLPPQKETLTQVRDQIYLSPQEQHFLSPPVLCYDQAQKEREDRCQKFINQDL